MGLLKRVSIVAIVVILVAIIVSSFFYPQQSEEPRQISFSTGFNQIKEIWKNQNITIDNYETDFEKIPLLSENQLLSLQSELQSFNSGLNQYSNSNARQALLLLSDIYLDLVNLNLLEKRIAPLDEQIGNVGLLEGCENILLFKQRNSLRREKLDLLKKLSNNVDSFISNYPSENTAVGFNSLDYDFGEIESDMQVKESAVISLEESC